MLTSSIRRSRAARIALLSCFGLLLLAGPGAADEATDQYNLAVGLYKQERWELAAESFRKFVEAHPDDSKVATARLYWGLALINDEQYEPARRVLRSFVKTHPDSPELPNAMYRVAEASYLLDDLPAAEAEFTAFLQKHPEHALGEWALPYLGDTQLRLEKAEAAAAAFGASLERFPEGKMADDSRFGLAKAQEAAGDREPALKLYQQLAARTTSPFAPQSQMNAGAILFDTGRYDEAAEAFAAVEERFPTHTLVAAARLNAGYAFYQDGDHRKAVEQFSRAAEDPAQAATAQYWQGISQKALGDFEQAAATLQQAFEAHDKSPLARNILYQWADCELRGGEYESAQKLFLQVAERWPESDNADDSLHFGTEAALLQAGLTTDESAKQKQLDEAERLLARFDREFPDSDLKLHQELLRGRLLDAQGSDADRKQAITHFRNVLEKSQLPRTQSLARFHLARVHQRLGDHAAAVETIEPLVEQAEQAGQPFEFPEALILAGTSYLELKRHPEAVAVATQYLALRPDGNQADQALATRALAAAREGDKAQARADLAALAERFSRSGVFPQTTHTIAELAYEGGDFQWASELFDGLVKLGPESSYYAVGLSGLAWSQYRLKEFDEAATSFGRLVREFPADQERTAEAAYMYGQALRDAGRMEDAIQAYADAFKAHAPERPAGPGADQQRPERFAYLAALQLARAQREQGDVKAADAAYAGLLAKFPKPAHGDQLLDEWALLHYEAENFPRADEIFRRLVNEYPNSDRADDARLNLAESDYIAGRIDAAEKEFRALNSDKSDDLVRQRALFQLIEISAEKENWDEVRTLAADLREQFPQSRHRWSAMFRAAEADLASGRLEAARDALLDLKSQADEPEIAQSRWLPRLWVLLAEAQLRLKQYDDVVATVEELRGREDGAAVLHLAHEILGRSYKSRAMPNFEKAREAFQKVLDDPAARDTETAAKSQLMIAETHWLQKDYKQAQEAYLKVYHLYDFPEWQAPALFQAAACDEQLNQWSKAVKAYEELMQKFPASEMAARAEGRLKVARQKAAAG